MLGISCEVDDAHMQEMVRLLREVGLEEASSRAVLRAAHIGTAVIKAATRGAMHNDPGGYDPYKGSNFKTPRVRGGGGHITAGAGYTEEGSYVRFRSTGTGPRYESDGDYSGIESARGMTQAGARVADPRFYVIARTEMDKELRKLDL